MNGIKEDCVMTVILIGGLAVGKTAIKSQFIDNIFQKYQVSISIEYSTTTIKVDDTTIKFKIWDTVILSSARRS